MMKNLHAQPKRLQTIERPKYKSFLKVKTTSQFPIEMLRYDDCRPVREFDSNRITRSIETHESCVVFVVRLHCDKDPNWTTGRWNSFGCKVRSVSHNAVAYRESDLAPEWSAQDDYLSKWEGGR